MDKLKVNHGITQESYRTYRNYRTYFINRISADLSERRACGITYQSTGQESLRSSKPPVSEPPSLEYSSFLRVHTCDAPGGARPRHRLRPRPGNLRPRSRCPRLPQASTSQGSQTRSWPRKTAIPIWVSGRDFRTLLDITVTWYIRLSSNLGRTYQLLKAELSK